MLPGEAIGRRIEPELHAAMAVSPVVAVTGARTTGKSTLVAALVARSGGTSVDLDDPAVRRLAAADPGAFVRGLPEPVVIDEFQRVPDLLAAIEAELNRNRRPGRLVLAGSARHDAVPELADFLTGRVELLRLWPFAMAELHPGSPSIVDRGAVPVVRQPGDARRRAGLRRCRDRAQHVRTRAVPPLGRRQHGADPQRRRARPRGRSRRRPGRGLPTAARTDVPDVRAAGVVGGEPHLAVSKRSKLHLVDSGLAAHLQGITDEQLRPTDPAGAARFGPLLETFVVTEVVKQLGWSSVAARPFHYRTPDGVQVDLVLEAPDGRVAAVEIKAGSAPASGTTRGLRHLRERLGDRFAAGLVVNTGSQAQQVDDRIWVAPVDGLWTA